MFLRVLDHVFNHQSYEVIENEQTIKGLLKQF